MSAISTPLASARINRLPYSTPDHNDREQGAALVAALDACDRCFGRGAVVPAAAGLTPARGWSTKFDMRPPRHTMRR
ncbi:DUF4113 domain-containing protein, partial [Psychrobacter sp. T6-3]|uniref:DUF4113 domain-containing protein n=1 Tax=Psychrobacter sp. T6-3 TaxID=3457449 RepID=UPI003FD22BF8